jgi:hypothetical protein
MIVAILGAGMSGMVAAKALDDMSIGFDIYDKLETNVSQQKGLHYLHGDVGLGLQPHRVKNFVTRDVKQQMPDYYTYSVKVWGAPIVLNNSMRNLPEDTIVYNFGEAYTMLSKKYDARIIKLEYKPGMLSAFQSDYDLVISTLPLSIMFPEYKCESKTVWVKDQMPENVELNDFTVMYNIVEGVPWYRCSKIFGQVYTEYVDRQDDCFPVHKIITCKELQNDYIRLIMNQRVLLVGRFAEWNRKRLAHQIYDIVQRGVRQFEL